jgi:ABC-type multidrug transport system fused ATPase/permease subunit
VLDSLLRQEVAFFDIHSVGDLSALVADATMRMQAGMGQKLGVTVHNLVRPGGRMMLAACSVKCVNGVLPSSKLVPWVNVFIVCVHVCHGVLWNACVQGTFVGGIVIGFLYNWRLTLVIFSFMPVLAISGALLKVRVCYACMCVQAPRCLLPPSPHTPGLRLPSPSPALSLVPPPLPSPPPVFVYAVVQSNGERFERMANAAYSRAASIATEALSGIRTVTAFGRQELEIARCAPYCRPFCLCQPTRANCVSAVCGLVGMSASCARQSR